MFNCYFHVFFVLFRSQYVCQLFQKYSKVIFRPFLTDRFVEIYFLDIYFLEIRRHVILFFSFKIKVNLQEAKYVIYSIILRTFTTCNIFDKCLLMVKEIRKYEQFHERTCFCICDKQRRRSAAHWYRLIRSTFVFCCIYSFISLLTMTYCIENFKPSSHLLWL